MSTDAPSRARDLIVDMLEQDPWPPAVERQAAELAPDSPVYREMESMADGLVIAVARQWGEEDPATVAEEVVDHFGSQGYAGPDGEPAPEFLIVRTALACLVSMGVVAPQWTTLATTFGRPTLARAAAEALRFLALQAAAQTDRSPEQLFTALRGGEFSGEGAVDADEAAGRGTDRDAATAEETGA